MKCIQNKERKEDRIIDKAAIFLFPLLYITVVRIAEGFILFSHPTTSTQQGISLLCLEEYIPFL